MATVLLAVAASTSVQRCTFVHLLYHCMDAGFSSSLVLYDGLSLWTEVKKVWVRWLYLAHNRTRTMKPIVAASFLSTFLHTGQSKIIWQCP